MDDEKHFPPLGRDYGSQKCHTLLKEVILSVGLDELLFCVMQEKLQWASSQGMTIARGIESLKTVQNKHYDGID